MFTTSLQAPSKPPTHSKLADAQSSPIIPTPDGLNIRSMLSLPGGFDSYFSPLKGYLAVGCT